MKIFAKVKPNSKEEKVEKIGENEFILRVKAPPKENKANEAAVDLLSEYFNVGKSRVAIIKGRKSKNKIIEISK